MESGALQKCEQDMSFDFPTLHDSKFNTSDPVNLPALLLANFTEHQYSVHELAHIQERETISVKYRYF